MKKRLALLLTIILCVSVFSGCDSSSSSKSAESAGTSTNAEPTTVVFAMKSFNVIPQSTAAITDEVDSYIKKKYPDVNIKVEYKLYGPAEYDQKINLMMQSGEQLDIFIPSNIATSLATNQLAPVTKALNTYGKDLMKITKEYCGDDIFDVVTQNGEIMAIPANKNMTLTPILSFDSDMLAATGYTADDITNLDSLTPIFAKLKKLYPNVYPFVSTDLANKNLPYYFYAEKQIDSLGNDFGVVFGDSGKVENVFESDEYLSLCKLMKTWYDNGYIPKDMATGTMTGAEYLKAGRGFCTFASYGSQNDYTDFGTMLTKQYGRNFAAKAISTSYLTTDFASAVLGIPSTSKNVDQAVQLLNIVYTDEHVYNTLLWGLEGEDYVKKTDNTVDYPDGLTADTVPYSAWMCMGEFGTENLCWTLENGHTDAEKQASLEFSKTVNKNANKSPYYGFRFDGSDVKNEITALTNVYEQYAYALMCGSVNIDSTLKSFNSALKSAGLDTVMAAKQKQLDAWLAEQK
jgi:putative aldouronate transport system substrate-binding protein